MDISIIIVNYNSGELLFNCLQSIFQNVKEVDYEIVVVDNMSSDTSFSRCLELKDPRLQLIQSGANLGFSKANNIGADHAKGKILHFLNPDTRVDSSIIDDFHTVIADYNKHVNCVYVNPLQDRDGTTYYERNALPDTLNRLRYFFCRSKTKWYYIGATIIISADTFKKIGKWNERFFMYGEDADLFCRINRDNIPIVELPSIIFHYGGGSSEKSFSSINREILIQKGIRLYRSSNQISWMNYWIWQLLVISSFWRRPKRMWWQIKALFYSFRR